MSENKELIKAIKDLEKNMNVQFKSVHKRLDGIEHELRKIDTVLGYSAQYENIPS